MPKSITLFSLLVTQFGAPAFAQNFYSGAEMVDRYFDIACGPREAVPNSHEFLEARRRFQSFLRSPQTEGSRILIDAATLGENPRANLLLICGTVLKFQKRLHADSCLTDKGEPIDITPALTYCRQVEAASRAQTQNSAPVE